MPMYHYKCAEHGVFEDLQTYELAAKPGQCPQCGATSPTETQYLPIELTGRSSNWTSPLAGTVHSDRLGAVLVEQAVTVGVYVVRAVACRGVDLADVHRDGARSRSGIDHHQLVDTGAGPGHLQRAWGLGRQHVLWVRETSPRNRYRVHVGIGRPIDGRSNPVIKEKTRCLNK